MNSFNKIAVVYRGHKRTWDVTKNNNFGFFAKLANNVDYYVSLWNEDDVVEDDIRRDFKEHNLVAIQIIDPESKFYNYYAGPAFLASLMIPKMIENTAHHQDKYDIVIDTRMDAYFFTQTYLYHQMFVDRNMLWSNNVGLINGNMGLGDLVFMSNLPTFCTWANRFHLVELVKNLGEDVHAFNYKLTKKLDLNPVEIPWFNLNLVRPNIFLEKDIFEILTNQQFFLPVFGKSTSFWNTELTIHEKIMIANRFKMTSFGVM